MKMINKLKVKQLREMAKDANVKGFSKLKKADLISELWTTREYGLILDYMEDYGVSLEVAQDMASE